MSLKYEPASEPLHISVELVRVQPMRTRGGRFLAPLGTAAPSSPARLVRTRRRLHPTWEHKRLGFLSHYQSTLDAVYVFSAMVGVPHRPLLHSLPTKRVPKSVNTNQPRMERHQGVLRGI